jgi:Tfp pilus assembly protein PilX
MKSQNNQSGQVVLMTLLILTVAVTLVLAFIGRTTTNTAITSQLEDSARAFNAAEAGIESALKTGANSSSTLSGGETFAVTVANSGGSNAAFEFPKKTSAGNTETLWLRNHNADGSINESSGVNATSGNIDYCWSEESGTSPALAMTLVYKRGTEYFTARLGLDPDASRRALNNFIAPEYTGQTCGGKPNMYRSRLTFTSYGVLPGDVPIMLRLKPVYASAYIIVDPVTATLPLQAKRIESTGASVGGATRKIVVYQQYKTIPAIFDSVLYSQSSLSN